MSDQDIFGIEPDSENDFLPEDAADDAAETTPEDASDAGTSVDDFVNEETLVDLGIDPSNVVTLRTSSGSSHYIAVSEPTKLVDLKLRSGLTYTTGTQFYLNGTPINDDAVVPMGATIMAVGSVKGG